MATKEGYLNRSEKLEIEKLIKCRRERKRQHLFEKLQKEQEKIQKPFNEKLKELDDKRLKIENEKWEAVKAAGYGKIHERGCFDTHPELDAFDEETNQELQKLWERKE